MHQPMDSEIYNNHRAHPSLQILNKKRPGCCLHDATQILLFFDPFASFSETVDKGDVTRFLPNIVVLKVDAV